MDTVNYILDQVTRSLESASGPLNRVYTRVRVEAETGAREATRRPILVVGVVAGAALLVSLAALVRSSRR